MRWFDAWVNGRVGIRAKLIALFALIKVVPLVLLAILAWQGVSRLGEDLTDETAKLATDVHQTVSQVGALFTRESAKALDDRAREELERLTTDTARAVADFLYERDRDVLLLAQLEPSQATYQAFAQSRTRLVTDPGEWVLADDGKSWVPKATAAAPPPLAAPRNAENQQDFHARPPETVRPSIPAPLYHEVTLVGLDGKELLKVSMTGLLPKDLRDVSRRENTWAKAETYLEHLKQLKPGEIYVSDVIGPYVPSHFIGPVTPEAAKRQGLPFAPEQEAYAGRENPLGRQFQGLVRWATPRVKDGKVVGYVTLALDHAHLRSFTDHIMPTGQRYTAISDATNGNYAFMLDYQDRTIAHPRHHSIVGFDPATGERATPWLEASIYEGWKASGLPLWDYLATVPVFDGQSRDKKPAAELTRQGLLGADCRYLNFAPQCQGWHDLTKHGGSGSFLILWSGVWKLTTAAVIPYFTGPYGRSPRGFGYVTIGANVDDFHAPAKAMTERLQTLLTEFDSRLEAKKADLLALIRSAINRTAFDLSFSTAVMLALVVAVAVWLASLLTRRITAWVAGLVRIEQGELSFRFPVTSHDELGQLNASLNRMADAVQAAFRQSEQARLQAEDNSRMKSEFVAHVSHELRTPLNGILGFAELIRDDAPTHTIREHAQTIQQSGQQLLTVVNDMLDVATIQSGRMVLSPQAVDVRTLLDEVALQHADAAQQKGLVLNTDFADDLPTAFVTDPARLRQVIGNLLSNAIRFTTDGGVTLSAWMDSGRLCVGVRDSGPGIAPEMQAQVFERFGTGLPFVARNQGGTGLGLALVRDLVHLMGGQVRLESVPGQGAYVEFWVPAGPTTAFSPAAPA